MTTILTGAVHDGAGAAVPAAMVAADAFVLPERLATGHDYRGPRFGDQVWDMRTFVPKTTASTRIDFATLTGPGHVRTAKEYLYSRINRAMPSGPPGTAARPMKITNLYGEFSEVRLILADLAAVGAPRLADVTRDHLEQVLAGWRRSAVVAAGLVGVVKHIAAHGPFLTDRMAIVPWLGRTANMVAGRTSAQENTTPRIPEQIIAPLVKAAVFYIQTAAGDLLAARAELTALANALRRPHLGQGEARTRLEKLVAARAAAGRGLPSMPAPEGTARRPNQTLTAMLAGVHGNAWYHRDFLLAAAARLGYEEGGLDTPRSPWPGTGLPWRPGLDPSSLRDELSYLRTACWLIIAYLSGMRDAEVRELARDCAFTEPGADGRIRSKLRGRVFKDRALKGDEAEWVVLDITHTAVAVLRQINDDPAHLFGWNRGGKHELLHSISIRLNRFAAHVNDLFTPAGAELFIPDADQAGPWAFSARQPRRTLAWHIAHQPFGVVAGTRQYQHAKITVFEGYAGTSASGFAAEVESEQAIARLDYAEDLYRDWNTAGVAGGGRIDAEFARIRAELSDLPGTVADTARLRTMLDHLALTLHPGVLGDCFYQPETALCAKHAKLPGRPLPMLSSCLSCPNARRTAAHLPRLEQARDQARQALDDAAMRPTPPLQHAALTGHLDQLDQLITQCRPACQEGHKP